MKVAAGAGAFTSWGIISLSLSLSLSLSPSPSPSPSVYIYIYICMRVCVCLLSLVYMRFTTGKRFALSVLKPILEHDL